MIQHNTTTRIAVATLFAVPSTCFLLGVIAHQQVEIIKTFYGSYFNQQVEVIEKLRGSSHNISHTKQRQHQEYIPSTAEKYIIEHATELGFASEDDPITCNVWDNPVIGNDLKAYSEDLDHYVQAIKDFEAIPDLLKAIIKAGSHDVCETARPHPDGITSLFPSKQLSLTDSGFVEPLTPPMRSQKICKNLYQHLLSLDYLVHDYEQMCKNLKPWSKRVLIDMGASLSFHGSQSSPIIALIQQYEKFGFVFDHIYGFEKNFTNPEKVYENLLPEQYMHNYHWINIGVNAEEGNKLNPLHSILKKFNEDDLIIVKLDIDTHFIEFPLAKQLLEGGENGIYHKLVDQFYFEHHVHQGELAAPNLWKGFMHGSVKDSLDLFYGLREMGVPAHFWP